MPPSSPVSFGNVPIPRPAPVPDFQPSQRRAMEATAMVRPPQNRTMLFVALGVAGVVAIGAALFLPSHPGRILINVADSQGASVNHVEIFVDGRKQCDTAPCVVDQVASGPHDVKVLADGYDAPPVQTITVESKKDETANFTLGSTAGTGIRVNGTQPGVKLYVDDKESGPLPQELRDLTPGDHVIKVAGSERYQPLEKHVTVERQKIQDLGTVTLKVLKGKATISLGTPGARVFLVSGSDRRELPMLPISVDIDTTKSWALEGTKSGFMDYKQGIGFDDGQAERSYVVSLDPKTAGAMAQTQPYNPPPTQVYAPAPRPVSRPAPQEAAPAPAGGEGAEAFLNINSIPPSNAFLDGRSLGSTPKVHVSVKPGSHTVKFVDSDDNLTKTVTVSVGAGETKGAVAKLN
jgi:serine/threonine-protein kinase